MPRYDWTDAELIAKLEACLSDAAMQAKLKATSAHMQARNVDAEQRSNNDHLNEHRPRRPGKPGWLSRSRNTASPAASVVRRPR